MESLLEKSASLARPHALPFRVFFEEHRLRNSEKLGTGAMAVFGKATADEAFSELRTAIEDQEKAYEELAAANASIGEDRYPSRSLDDLTATCAQRDDPLTRLLHAMDASALCLSGGGIRSASFSLGVLEGMSLFSAAGTAGEGIMHHLDYLSTVSGGGYMGSWLIAWVHQRQEAKNWLICLKDLLERLERNERKAPGRDLAWLGRSARDLVSRAEVVQTRALAEPATTAVVPGLIRVLEEQADLLKKTVAELKKVENDRYSYVESDQSTYKDTTAVLEKVRSEAATCWKGVRRHLTDAYWDVPANEREAFHNTFYQAAYSEVVSAMAEGQPVTAGDAEPQAVRHLRSYTSFLAPSMGFTLDSFTLLAIVLRNLLVNWVMVLPVLFTLISAAKITGFATADSEKLLPGWLQTGSSTTDPHRQHLIDVLLTAVYFVASIAAAFCLPSHHKRIGQSLRRWSAVAFVTTVILASWLLTISEGELTAMSFWDSTVRQEAIIGAIDFGVLAVSIWLAFKARIGQTDLGKFRGKAGAAAMGIVTTACISLLSVWLLQLDRHYLYPVLLWGGNIRFLQIHASESRLFIVFALPVTVSILLVTTTLLTALLGIFEMEEDREWWVRCGGAFLLFNLGWILAHGIAFYGQGGLNRLYAGFSGLGLGLIGSLVGSSGATSAGPQPVKTAQLSSIGRYLQKHNMILPVTGGLSLILIALGVTALEEKTRMILQPLLMQMKPFAMDANSVSAQLYGAVVLFGISLGLSVLINFAININLFSLHGMYRMRLMRAFLGASNVFRRPDPFTNFDPKDTPHEKDLPVCPGVPLHVINTTLNLTGTKNTAWSQRRAESFTFSPVTCGGWRVGYVKTESYGGTRGVTLATAMAISGAAFNPNMGYQSSPILSLLMTFFNLRLGCWLPNPKRPTPKLGAGSSDEIFFRKSGPSFALKPLIAEALGNTDDSYRWIELTDGGHFENLALYEMVMRRCKHIIVVDAGADPTCSFEDLGNAIRKIQIDFGIPIIFPPHIQMSAGMRAENSYCAVATIQYSCVDKVGPGQSRDDLNGHLVYIKAGLTGEEPADILQYAKTHPTFPHENTGNQFFSESQFESYRHLGTHIVRCIGEAAASPQPRQPNSFAAFMQAAWNHWKSREQMNLQTTLESAIRQLRP